MIVTAFDGSPRKNGNSTLIMKSFIEAADKLGADIFAYRTDELDIQSCKGCLKCNLLKKCVISNDQWQELAERIENSDILVFATPVYFHHTTASMKKLLDRFRSFIHVKINENSIIHTPTFTWDKKFVLITSQGSPVVDEAKDLNRLFSFITKEFGENNQLHIINATRLAVTGQVKFRKEKLKLLYKKLDIPEELVEGDYTKNLGYINEAANLAASFIKKEL